MMTREAFHARFSSPGPVVLPVVHVRDTAQTLANLDTAFAASAPGAFLINHDFGVQAFLPLIRTARTAFPQAWIGVNFLAVTGRDAFAVLGRLAREGVRIDAYWADDARIDERASHQTEADAIQVARTASGWDGLYFGGTAFKKQRPVAPEHWQRAAALAAPYMDAVTTSGTATGEAAALDKITAFRVGAGARPLALASGVTPENAAHYAGVDAFLVATGINHPGDFYTIDPARLTALLEVSADLGRTP